MAKSANQKRKLPILAKLLLERSDEEHPISRQEMQEELERWGITAERKSIYDDMEQLKELGLDVQSRRGRGGGWYIGGRDFELAELKLLVDAVQSSRFLTKRKSDALIRKLEGLTNVHQARPAAGVCGPAGQDHEREHFLQRGQAPGGHRGQQGGDFPLF